jgi:transcriptional regulator with XRE-family HTH domain
MSKIKKSFPEALLQWRIRKGLTQEEVGTRMGLSRSVISFLENGKQKPKPLHLILFQDHWGVDFSESSELNDSESPQYGLPNSSHQNTNQILEMYNSIKEVRAHRKAL